MSKAALQNLILVAAAALVFVSVLRGVSWAPGLADRLRDDAYYEFAWAANVAAGRGPTVSDGVTTSGVQLLWSLSLVPFAWLFGAASLPVLAPWLGLLLHGATALSWLRAVRDRRAGAVLALCWFAHPLLLRESQNGQETALACLCAVRLWRARRAGTARFAAWSALAVFARSDLLALAFVLAARRGVRQLFVPMAVLAAFAGVNVVLGGGPWPDSALPMAWLWHANFARTEPDSLASLQRHWWFARPVLLGGPWSVVGSFGTAFCAFRLLRPWLRPTWRWVPLAMVVGAALVGAHDLLVPGLAGLLFAVLPATGGRGRPRRLLWLTLASAAIVVVHWAVRWYPRDYYLAPVVLLPFVAVAAAGRWRWPLLALVCGQAVDAWRFLGEPLQGQREMELAGRYLGEVLPAGERVGCFNSGIVTFLQDAGAGTDGARRGVVNLDGVVDRRAFDALQSQRLGAWLDEEGVACVLDNAGQFATDPRLPHASGPWFAAGFDPARDLVELARFDVPQVAATRPGTDGFRLYLRRGAGRTPPRDLGVARVLGGDGRGGQVVLVPLAAGDALQCEAADGGRSTLATVDVATRLVIAVPPALRGTGRLFVAGGGAPVLVLPPL